ncbi:flagellar motor switch protein FliN [Microcella daejeonensis]|uniref:flagellar motor switch protein FliN n=1 Tax=Microcella daejeonensis TaxID=2994971 RepID=UPI002271F6B2|nr:flagellar motor switch protein FliN [Microcella daejeonensis]WAB83878.1 flagellar motor switch protein FliN [Microcella daejeonensis]
MTITAPVPSTGLELAAARAFAAALPVQGVTVVEQAPPAALLSGGADAVLATFVGATTSEFGVLIADAAALTGGAEIGDLPVDALLRPALEAAASTFGAGVLGDARAGDAGVLLDRGAAFALTTDTAALGWLIIATSAEAPASRAADGSARLGRINDVAMTLTVEIGRTTMPVRGVLALEPGSVVELDRSAGAPADILLNGRRIALGEIVVVDQDYAVRITRILDTAETTD